MSHTTPKNPEPEETALPEDLTDPVLLREMNSYHCNAAGKFFQMFMGTSSAITSVNGGWIHLDLHTTGARGKGTLSELALGIAESWRKVFPGLRSSPGFVAHIYKTNHPTGFVHTPDPGNFEESVDYLYKLLKRSMEPTPDILLKIVKCHFPENSNSGGKSLPSVSQN
jgi:hypothetical protein